VIAIYTPGGQKLGCVPRETNPVIASIADHKVPVAVELVFLDQAAPPWGPALEKVFQLI
jgi:hypothetical protein